MRGPTALDMAKLAAEVRTTRIKRDLTMRQAAEQIGTTLATWSRIEAGQNRASADLLILLMRWIGESNIHTYSLPVMVERPWA